ncbi:MAG: hypothetical protein KAH31_12260, partial [Candidatus Sabulitectum sp.]|nr:hypothetical protein [Candidatus Sabulitectum sp.]
MKTTTAVLFLAAVAAVASASFESTVNNVAEMVWNNKVIDAAAHFGLDVVNVTWEDTGRYEGSCWGPNISDMTIQVH